MKPRYYTDSACMTAIQINIVSCGVYFQAEMLPNVAPTSLMFLSSVFVLVQPRSNPEEDRRILTGFEYILNIILTSL